MAVVVVVAVIAAVVEVVASYEEKQNGNSYQRSTTEIPTLKKKDAISIQGTVVPLA